jgi:hypothetical protein
MYSSSSAELEAELQLNRSILQDPDKNDAALLAG